MRNTPTVGQILTDLDEFGIPWTIQAVALHWDILDVAVILAKADNSGWVVTDYSIQQESCKAFEIYSNAEEATQNYYSRAFGM